MGTAQRHQPVNALGTVSLIREENHLERLVLHFGLQIDRPIRNLHRAGKLRPSPADTLVPTSLRQSVPVR